VTRNLSNALYCAGCLLLALASRLAAQSPSPSAPEDAALQRVVERLEEQDEAMRKSVMEFSSVVESEEAAGRISGTITAGLEAAARESLPPILGDARVLFARARIPAANAPVMRGLKNVEDTALETQVLRATLIFEAEMDARERARQIAFGARNSSDVEPFIGLVTRLKAVALAHCAFGGTGAALEAFRGLERFSRALSAALDPHLKDPAIVGAVTDKEFNIAGHEDIGLHGLEGLGRFKSRLLAPWNAEVEKETWSLLAALAQRKSPSEVYDAMRRVDEAGKLYGSIFTSNPWNGVHGYYRQMAAIEASLNEPGANWVDQNIAGLIRDIDFDRSSPPNHAASFAEAKRILLEWQKQRQDSARLTARLGRGGEGLLAKIKGAHQLADLDALAADLQARYVAGLARNAYDLQRANMALVSLFERLRSAAGAADFSRLSESDSSASGGVDPEIMEAFADLRRRMVREALGRVLRAPEMSRPPMANQPIDKALDELCQSLAAAGQWPRVAGILEIRNSRRFTGDIRMADADALASVRLFLAGQNFELAEQWADAASAYKGVLRTAAEGAPIKEAVERLKALKHLHPDATASLP
jgi:tetratricopeptide (TPR) repeat protein